MNAALVIPELGQLAMILAICFACVQATVPLLGAWRGDSLWMSLDGRRPGGNSLSWRLPLAV